MIRAIAGGGGGGEKKILKKEFKGKITREFWQSETEGGKDLWEGGDYANYVKVFSRSN